MDTLAALVSINTLNTNRNKGKWAIKPLHSNGFEPLHNSPM